MIRITNNKFFAATLFLTLVSCFLSPVSGFAQGEARDPNELYAIIDTNRGAMEFLLYRQVAPIAVSSFVNLATRGFYDGLTFHRVIDGFMAQGGDPKGNGSGGPGYQFENEAILRFNQPGQLAMANAGPDTNGSQFFITHGPQPHLNGGYSLFGLIQTGQDIVRQIKIGDTINSITIEGDAKAFLEKHKDRVYKWNQSLDLLFPNLKPALTD